LKIDVQNFTVDKKLKDYIEPKKFKKLIGEKNSLFKGVKACDSKDLIIFFLENIDNELTLRNNGSDKKEFFNGCDVSQLEKEFFKKCHNSIVADLFYGFQRSRMMCDSCRKPDDNYTIFNFLVFPLEKIYNSLNQNNIYNKYSRNFNFGMPNNRNNLNPHTYITPIKKFGLKNANKKKLNLYDCFRENQKEEKLYGQNQIFCNKCKKHSNATTIDEIYKAPNVLILIINRGKGNIFECDLDFPIELNISQFVKDNHSPKRYDLIGVISHLGESSMEGHFIAICKHFDDNWYLFNDARVIQINEKDIYKGTPYILFYQNKNLKL
jgi:ubiquitin C-terminal hydrolase